MPTQSVTLPGQVYRKLAQGAAERGMSVESLLAVISDLVAAPDRPTEEERSRSRAISDLLDRFRAGELTAADRRRLNDLIDADYEAANARADRMIRDKEHKARQARSNGKSKK